MAATLDRGARLRGSLVGVAVGDALGWPQEQNAKNVERGQPTPELKFRPWRRRSGGRYQPFEEVIGAGEFSDDTQLTLCSARSVMHGEDWFEHFTRRELPVWSLYERGGGRSVLKAARSWATGHPPWSTAKSDPRDYFATGANGVAMRVLPHVAAALDNDFGVVRRRIALDACTTHGHAAALIGALMQAWTLWTAIRLEGTLGYGELLDDLADHTAEWADHSGLVFPEGWLDVRRQMSGAPYEDEWKYATEEAHRLLGIARASIESGPVADDEDTFQRIGLFDRKVNGSGIVTAVGAALIASRSASSPELGLLQSAFLQHADSDTLASMTTALLGAIAGDDWMNGLQRSVQDSQYLVAIAGGLGSRSNSVVSANEAKAVTKSSLDRWTRALSGLDRGHVDTLPNGRGAILVEVEEIPTKSAKSATVRYRLRADDGETLFVVKSSRLKADRSGEVSGISHIGVRVRVASLTRSRKFYEEVLGLRPSRTGDSFARYGDAFALEMSPSGSRTLGFTEPDFVIQVVATNVGAIHSAVQSSGAKVVESLREERGRARFKCSDPDGNLIEIVAPQATR